MSHSTSKLGQTFTWLGWILGFFLLALLFQKVLDAENNPNQNLQSISNSEYEEVILKRNRFGHYVLDAQVNGKTVTFLVDTGATYTSVPASWESKLGLQRGREFRVETANGTTTAYLTRLGNISLGGLDFDDVTASITPGLQGREGLLGMNVLKNLDLIQRGDTLIMRQYRQ